MNELPRQKLQEIITKYGFSLCDDSRRCEGLLKDLCGEYRGEIFILIAALKEGIAIDLLKSTSNTNNEVLKEVLLAKLVKRLQNNLGLTEESAIWVVDAWAIALGITSQPLAKSSDSGKDYESKLQQYELEFLRAIQKEYPLDKNIDDSLNNLYQSLSLKKEDVQKISSSIISQKEREIKSKNSQVVLTEKEAQRLLKSTYIRNCITIVFLIFYGLNRFFNHQSIVDLKNKNKQLNQQILKCELKAEKLSREILPVPENIPQEELFPWEHR